MTVESFQPLAFAAGAASAVIDGGTKGETVNVTVETAGEFCAPGAVTVTCPVYVPAVRLPTATETDSVAGADPLAGVAVNHDWSLVSVKLRVPLPVFVILKF